MQERLLRKLFLGFIQVHILGHARRGPIYGAWMIDELKHHGYDLSPGTLYPILHQLEALGLLKKHDEVVAGKRRVNYTLTHEGDLTLSQAKAYVTEMYMELNELEAQRDHSPDLK